MACPRLPDSLDTPDILVGWSLERQHQRRPVGFHFGDPAVSPVKGYLDPVMLSDEGHLVTIAPTGAGKGVGAIIPTLLRYDGPVIVVDPKGENVAVTARRRREMGQAVRVIDPMGLTGEQCDRLNPLDAIEAFTACDVDDVAALVSTLFSDYTDSRNTYWYNRAKDLIIGAVLYVLADEPPEKRTLCRVREIVGQVTAPDSAAVAAMVASSHPEAQLVGRSLTGPHQETLGSIVSVALDALGFLRGGEVQHSVSASTFSLATVTDGDPVSIFLVLPPDKLESHAPLLRLWIGTLMNALVRRRRKPPRPTLFILDEAAQLGTLPQLRTAMTLMRGYGVQTWSFWQDVSQLHRLYPDDWPTMLSNCKVIQAFGANSPMAATKVAELTGFGDPTRILELESEEMILQIAGDQPVIARKPNYLADPPFTGLADPNPFYAEVGPVSQPPRPPSRWYSRPASKPARVPRPRRAPEPGRALAPRPAAEALSEWLKRQSAKGDQDG